MLESLVDDWGVIRHRTGKTVWFRVSGPDNDLPDPDEPRADQPGVAVMGRDNVDVELRNMPLLLHAAWQEHAEALLREYLLANLDSEGADPIQMHADATDAIAVLEEHVPRATVAMSPDELMGDAVEPQVSASRVEVPGAARVGGALRDARPGDRGRPRPVPGGAGAHPADRSRRCRRSAGGSAARC